MQIEQISLDQLSFDPENPRLPSSLRKAKQKQIIEWMLLDASLLDLMSSIAQNGFFAGEPILVVKNGNDYHVVEGNRRLAATLLLNNPGISKTKSRSISEILESSKPENIPTSLPAVIFPSKNEVLDYLGYRHVTGIKSWGPLAKARYLNELYNSLKGRASFEDKCRKLARKIGSKSPYTKQLLVSYWLFEILEENGFYKIRGLSEESIEFSHMYDSLRFTGLREFLNIEFESRDPIKNLDKKNYKEYCTWLYEKSEGQTRLGDSRQLKVLNKVVQSKEALHAFRSGKSLSEASQYSDYPDELLQKHIYDAYQIMKEALDVSGRANHLSEVDLDNLKSISKFSKMIHSSFFNDDF